MQVKQILSEKGTTVHTVAPGAMVRTAIDALAAHRVGALLVLDESGRLIGLLSERDIVAALARLGTDAVSRRVHEVMTRDVVTCSPEDRVNDAMAVMTRRRMRHLAVVDRGQLAGVISVGDLVKARLNELEFESNVLRDAYLRVR